MQFITQKLSKEEEIKLKEYYTEKATEERKRKENDVKMRQNYHRNNLNYSNSGDRVTEKEESERNMKELLKEEKNKRLKKK